MTKCRPHGLRRASTVVVAALVLSSVVLGLATQARAQGSFPEFAGPTGSLSGQFRMPATTRLASGRFVVALYLHGKPLLSSGTYFQIYTPLGQPAGGFTRVKPMLALDDVFPKVVGAGNGFVVVYNARAHIDSPQQILAQRYSGAGVKLGSEFKVNATNFGFIDQHQVAQLADGGFVVTWSASPTTKSNKRQVYARRYDSKGVPVTAEFIVNTTTNSSALPTVAPLATGGFVIAWGGIVADRTANIFAQRYAANGTKAGGQFPITSTPAHSETVAVIAGLHNGGFVVAWTNNPGVASVSGRRFTASGLPNGAEFSVGEPNQASWEPITIAVLDDDRFMVAYSKSGTAIYARLFAPSAASTPGPEFAVNSTPLTGFNERTHPSAVALSNRNMFVAWELTPSGKATQTRMRRLDLPPVP